MSRGSHPLSSLLLAAALASSLAGIACGDHHAYRVYDPYYTDYHVWNNDEIVYYNRWTVETHRDPHRDFRKPDTRTNKKNTGPGATTTATATKTRPSLEARALSGRAR